MNIDLIVHGAAGRMGRSICNIVNADPTLHIVAAIERQGSNLIGERCAPTAEVMYSDSFPTDQHVDVIIDFSSDEGAQQALKGARACSAALFIGTTALSKSTLTALKQATADIAVLIAPNTSTGITVLSHLVGEIGSALADECDIAILEAHRAGKKDAPSGTALHLANLLRQAGAQVEDDQILSVRGGDVFGEHTVRFAMNGEYLDLTHRATKIEVFSEGALRAARWLARQKPGLYSMSDALADSSGS